MVLLALACPIAPVIFAGWGIWHLQQHILGWATGSTAVKSGSLALQHPPDQAQQTKWLYAQRDLRLAHPTVYLGILVLALRLCATPSPGKLCCLTHSSVNPLCS